MNRLRDNLLNAIVMVVVLAACATAVHNWFREPKIEHVRIYQLAPRK